jgi:hypothetical protein
MRAPFSRESPRATRRSGAGFATSCTAAQERRRRGTRNKLARICWAVLVGERGFVEEAAAVGF